MVIYHDCIRSGRKSVQGYDDTGLGKLNNERAKFSRCHNLPQYRHAVFTISNSDLEISHVLCELTHNITFVKRYDVLLIVKKKLRHH